MNRTRISLAFILWIAVAIGAFGCLLVDAAESAEKILSQGDAQFKAGEYREALRIFQEAQQKAPADMRLLYRVVHAANKAREPKPGLEAIDKMVSLDPELKSDKELNELRAALSTMPEKPAAQSPELQLAVATAEAAMEDVRKAVAAGDLDKAQLLAWDAWQNLEPALADGNNLDAWILAGRIAGVIEQDLLAAYAVEAILRLKPDAMRDKELRGLVGELNRRSIKDHVAQISALRKRTHIVVTDLRQKYPAEESEAAAAVVRNSLNHVVKPQIVSDLLDEVEKYPGYVHYFRFLALWEAKIRRTESPDERLSHLVEFLRSPPDALDVSRQHTQRELDNLHEQGMHPHPSVVGPVFETVVRLWAKAPYNAQTAARFCATAYSKFGDALGWRRVTLETLRRDPDWVGDGRRGVHDLIERGYLADARFVVPLMKKSNSEEKRAIGLLIRAYAKRGHYDTALSLVNTLDSDREEMRLSLIALLVQQRRGSQAEKLADGLDRTSRQAANIVFGKPDLEVIVNQDGRKDYVYIEAIDALVFADNIAAAGALRREIKGTKMMDIACARLANAAERVGDYGNALQFLDEMKDSQARTPELHRVTELAFWDAVGRNDVAGAKSYAEKLPPNDRSSLLKSLVHDQSIKRNFVEARRIASEISDLAKRSEAMRYIAENLAIGRSSPEPKVILDTLDLKNREAAWRGIARRRAQLGNVEGAKAALEQIPNAPDIDEVRRTIALCERVQGTLSDFERWADSLELAQQVDAWSDGEMMLFNMREQLRKD